MPHTINSLNELKIYFADHAVIDYDGEVLSAISDNIHNLNGHAVDSFNALNQEELEAFVSDVYRLIAVRNAQGTE